MEKSRAILIICLFLAGALQARETVPVTVQPVTEILVDMERNAPAEVLSLNVTTVSAEVTAIVRRVLTDVGREIKQGDLLLELDTSDYRLAVQQAEASLAASRAQKMQADARLTRAQTLGTNQYISADDLLARETEVMVLAAQIRVQEAALAIAQRNLEKCEITAPFNGYVTERKAQLGAWVNPGSPLLVLTQTDRIELDAEIPDELSASLLQADSMQFVSRNESWQVRLLRISPGMEMERRSRRARFEFLADAPTVGRSGEIVWRVEKGMLPANLMVRRNGVLGVFLNRSNTAKFMPLPGAQEGRPVAADLPGDVEIIVLGRDRLQDGDTIIPNHAVP